jgi:hypothetical protein
MEHLVNNQVLSRIKQKLDDTLFDDLMLASLALPHIGLWEKLDNRVFEASITDHLGMVGLNLRSHLL